MDQNLYDSLVHDLYLSVLDERHLGSFVQRLGAAFPGVVVAFHVESIADRQFLNPVPPQDRNRAYAANLGEEAIESYAAHYVKVNPWITGLTWAPQDQVLHSEMSMETADFLRTEFYGDFMRLQEDVRTSDALLARRDDNTVAGLAASVPHRREEADRPVIAELLEHLRPHLQLATDLVVRDLDRDTGRRFSAASLDRIGEPALAVDENGRLLLANAPADRLFEAGALSISSEGQLVGAAMDRRGRLAAALTSILQGAARSSLVPLETQPRHGAPAFVCITSLEHAEPHHPLEVFLSGWRARALIVFVGLDEPRHPEAAAVLANLFHLTRSEAELALAISDGLSLEDYAGAHGVSRNTVRNQLSSVFRKTGVGRQGHLALLIRRMLALSLPAEPPA